MKRVCDCCGHDTDVPARTPKRAVVLCRRCERRHYAKPVITTLADQGRWDNAVRIVEDKDSQ